MKTLLVLLALCAPASAGQIDYYLAFANKAAAIADAQASPFWDAVNLLWRGDMILEVTVTRQSTGLPIAGYFVLVSMDHPVSALLNHASLQVALDRDKCRLRQAGCLVKSNVSVGILQDIRIAPIFEGTNYPYGSLN